MPDKRLFPEETDLLDQDGNQGQAQQGGDDQIEQDEQGETGHHGPAPLAADPSQGVRAVLVMRIGHGLLPVPREGPQEGPVICLPIDENLVLDSLVALLRIVVGGFQQGGRLRIMRAVTHQLPLLVDAVGKQFLRIEQAAVPVLLPQ